MYENLKRYTLRVRTVMYSYIVPALRVYNCTICSKFNSATKFFQKQLSLLIYKNGLHRNKNLKNIKNFLHFSKICQNFLKFSENIVKISEIFLKFEFFVNFIIN